MKIRSAAEGRQRVDTGTRVIRLFAWLAKAKYTHGAIVIVRNESGDVLLVQERLRERQYWGLPGGFMRVHETPLRAAVRELREEVGLEIAESALERLDEYHQPWAWHYDHLFALTVHPPNATGGTSRELRGHGWFPANDLPPLTRAADYALSRCGMTAPVEQPVEA
ncbi:MAG TPA: NUDIX hydrolase [Jatrophihabitans sp.]|jgi:ADP-ribose pyrophosphatase YjhB (NUDIX family)|nr:NUDIX hydrolase [Jatrophihabitans sp.]